MLTILGLLFLHLNFRIGLSISKYKFQQVTFEGLGYPNLIILKKLIILNLYLNANDIEQSANAEKRTKLEYLQYLILSLKLQYQERIKQNETRNISLHIQLTDFQQRL